MRNEIELKRIKDGLRIQALSGQHSGEHLLHSWCVAAILAVI